MKTGHQETLRWAMAAAVTGDSGIQEAAADVAETDWRYWGGPASARWAAECGETREITWPLLVRVTAIRETGNAKYWQKAQELMAAVLEQEQRSGAKGYISNCSTKALGWIQLFCDRAARYFARDAGLAVQGDDSRDGGATAPANGGGRSGSACFIGALNPWPFRVAQPRAAARLDTPPFRCYT